MSSPNPELLQLGAVGIIFLFFIKEFFQWLKNKKNNNNKEEVKFQLMLLNQKVDNHIQHIRDELIEIREDIRDIKNKLS